MQTSGLGNAPQGLARTNEVRLADELVECARTHAVREWTIVRVHRSAVFTRIDTARPQALDAPCPVPKAEACQYERQQDTRTVRERIAHIHVPGIRKDALQNLDRAAHEEEHQGECPVLPPLVES